MASLKKAIVWAKRAVELNDSYDANLLVAQLYFKSNDKKAALKYAKIAKTIATEMTWNSKDVDALLAQLKSN